jgi:hypothetical protein
VTPGEQLRFLKDLRTLCEQYEIELETCGCDDGLRAFDKGKGATLFGIEVKDGEARARTEYLDGEEIVILGDGTSRIEPYRFCRRCDDEGMAMSRVTPDSKFSRRKCETCHGTKRTP